MVLKELSSYVRPHLEYCIQACTWTHFHLEFWV
ncbi:hypothetical protein E2C01_028223 [Portunus trituberculatus]|uniref:Uncharacterized protein n=1 Tax=Portunus trituberculatus TaxID=210409 RepID=A0A5B7ENR2_PORTR|nr:hypothetical protein [Portunus trituberculatus]